MITETTYSTTDLTRLIGCSFRQLDWWVRSGLIDATHPATGTGDYRKWTADQVPVLLLIHALMDAGLEGPRVAEMLHLAGPVETWHGREMRVELHGGVGYFADLQHLLERARELTS